MPGSNMPQLPPISLNSDQQYVIAYRINLWAQLEHQLTATSLTRHQERLVQQMTQCRLLLRAALYELPEEVL
jgi:hypothetical protein